jgi:NADH-quinone oxidoreductase subunit D
MSQEHGYCLAIEKLVVWRFRLRDALMPVLFLEISRIKSHHLNITTQAMDVGALTPPLWGIQEREKLMVLLRACRRARGMHANYFPAGRRSSRICRKSSIDAIETAGATRSCRSAATCDELVIGNRILSSERRISGLVDPRGPWKWGFSGVMVRGSGRLGPAKGAAYECYEELEFDIPVGRNGDNYDRQIIRMEEMRQSVGIMKQCLERLRLPAGQGPIAARDGKVVPPSRKDMKRSMEALIQHFKLYTEGFHVPAGEVYAAVEAPKGEFGVYLVADGTNKAYRCKIRAPSFVHLQAMDSMCRGHMLADVSAVLGSLDIVFGEVDR